ncbi:relaxase/mobilization nuclease domain-containing protein [Marivirga tractuosa]|nr:relaxase/mobilization nuclease domain-containing protein [Marivirga tractuosa]
MIGKTGTGRSFGGLIEYLLDEKKEAEILAVDGVCDHDKKTAIEDFNMMRKQLPTLGKAVWHSSISFAEGDNMSNEEMKEIASEFMQEMGLENTQYMVVKHNDSKHQHLHIVANRVNYEGKAISDSHSKRKTVDRCEKIAKKHGLTNAKEQGNQRKEAIKKTIYQGIDQGKDLAGIMKGVEKLGYTVQYNQAKTGKISGVSYKMEDKGIIFKASEIDRNLSYTKLLRHIEEHKEREKTKQKQQDKSKNISTKRSIDQSKGMSR